MLRPALECIRKQKVREGVELEHVVWDDGSDDLTIFDDLKRDNPEVIFHTENKNGGLGHARNAAIETTDSDLLLPLDADDYFSDSSVDDMVGVYLAKKSVPVYPTVTLFGGMNQVNIKPEWSKEQVFKQFFIPASSLFTRESFDKIKGYTPNMPFLEDFDMWVRMALAGYKGAYCKPAMLYYNIRANSMSDHFDLKDTGAQKRELAYEILRRNNVT